MAQMSRISRRALAVIGREWKYAIAALLVCAAGFLLIGRLPAYWESSWAWTARLLALCSIGLGAVGSLEWRRIPEVWSTCTALGRPAGLAARALAVFGMGAALSGSLLLVAIWLNWPALGTGRMYWPILGWFSVSLQFYAVGYLGGVMRDLRLGLLGAVAIWAYPMFRLPGDSSSVLRMLRYVLPTHDLYRPVGLAIDYPLDPAYGLAVMVHSLGALATLSAVTCLVVSRRDLPLPSSEEL
jgi:hypothetical protein